MFVYTPNITPRVEYIFKFVLTDILGIKFSLTSNFEEFSSYTGAKINYSTASCEALQIVPHKILFQTDHNQQFNFEMGLWDELPAFAKTSDEADIKYDIFAASFYLVSRYEEYNCTPDKHGRFQSAHSMAARHNFLQLPLVDFWASKLLRILTSQWPTLEHTPRKFNHLLTFDLDSSFAIAHKGMRTVAAMTKSLTKLNIKDFWIRILVLIGRKPDPFDLLTELFNSIGNNNSVKWFIHVGRYSKFDKPASANNRHVKKVIKRIANKYEIGLHPSYTSFNHTKKIGKEKTILKNICRRDICSSRFHYLRFSLPYSYVQLMQNGLTADFSMGYPDTFGFRASTCTPFNFFNLDINRTTNLKIYPFQCMDSIIAKHAPSERGQLLEQIKATIDATCLVNGTFISIWHIDYLSGYLMRGNLWNIFNATINYIKCCRNGN